MGLGLRASILTTPRYRGFRSRVLTIPIARALRTLARSQVIREYRRFNVRCPKKIVFRLSVILIILVLTTRILYLFSLCLPQGYFVFLLVVAILMARPFYLTFPLGEEGG